MSTFAQFQTELSSRLNAQKLIPTRVWEVSGYVGHQFEHGRIFVSTAKTDGPRWITTTVEVPGREPKKPNGKIRSMFKSDDLEALQYTLEALASGQTSEPERRTPVKKASAPVQAPAASEQEEETPVIDFGV